MSIINKNIKKGFSFVELVTVIAILAVFLLILVPSLLRYTETSRMQKDDSAMNELCNSVHLSLANASTFDETFEYAVKNNYLTYTDSSGVYGQQIKDEEYWAPDGSGYAVTITFNPDDDGNFIIANGIVNDMTYGNGSVADKRTAEGIKQCFFHEMGDGTLYHEVRQAIGSQFIEKSVSYKYSSYTVFIRFDLVDGTWRATVYGYWNGTNLGPGRPASLGSSTSQYDENEKPIIENPEGGTTEAKYDNSDLGGSGTLGNTPSYKKYLPCGHEDGSPGDHSMRTDCEHYACRCSGCVIPAGGKYVAADGTIYNPGDTMPDIVTDGDIYTYHDYKYTYFDEYNGWKVSLAVAKTKTTYGVILEAVNNKPITNVNSLFYSCKNMKESPAIPDTVTSMYMTYEYCQALLTPPEMPSALITAERCFQNTQKLQYVPLLPNGVENVSNMVSHSGVKSYIGSTAADGDFSNYKMPDSIINASAFFYNCSEIVIAPTKLPQNVKTIHNMFGYCKNLKVAPVIPDSATSIYGIFSYCTNLETYVGNTDGLYNFSNYKLPENAASMSSVFASCKKLVTPPRVIPTAASHLDGMFEGCTSLTSAPVINKTVSSICRLFSGCKSLTGVVEIHSTADSKQYEFQSCFAGVDFSTQNIKLIGSSTYLHHYGGTGNLYCALCQGKCTCAADAFIGATFTDGNRLTWAALKNSANASKYKYSTDFTDTKVSRGFTNTTTITVLRLPTTVTSASDYAYSCSTSLKSITINKNSIPNYAFSGCTSLTTIVFRGTVAEWNNLYKGSNWNKKTPKLNVYCTDGIVVIESTGI